VSDPFIVCWPKGMKARGEVRTQFCHAIDMVPTVLDCLGIEPPTQIRGITQSPIQGFSLKSSFDDAKAEALHKTQYFEMFGHRSLYHDGWRAVCPWPGTSFVESGLPFGAPMDHDKLNELDAKGWELYNLTFSVSILCPNRKSHQREDSRRSHFVTSFDSLHLPLGCVWLLLELGVCCKRLI
jgi:arylsulfatase A-like enzyme